MAYIECENTNYYKPSDSLRDLFEHLILTPLKNALPEEAADLRRYYNPELSKVVLKRGATNFDKPFPWRDDEPSEWRDKEYTPEHKVLLYCAIYMPMHLFSSYHIFTNYLRSISNKVIFIDFGCGPLTSGIAFWAAFVGYCDIAYIGIDKSQTMLRKAKEINRYGYDGYFFFPKNLLTLDFNLLHESLEQNITNGDQTQIIFNFCYSLASYTLDTENLSVDKLSNIINQTAEKYNRHETFVIYQNPPIPEGLSLQNSQLHENWDDLKTILPAFRSGITGLNTEAFEYDEIASGRRYDPNLYFDILSNRPN